MSALRYYHFYAIPSRKRDKLRRRNIEPVRTAKDARECASYWKNLGYPTGVFINDKPQSDEFLPAGSRVFLPYEVK